MNQKTSTKHISCECKCIFDRRKCETYQCWNNDKWRWECKKHYICEKDSAWNSATCNSKIGNYLASIIDY